MMRNIKNESGQALLLVMMVMMVLLLIGAAAVTRTSESRLRSFEQKKIVQSTYIAEAGVEKVLGSIKNNYLWLKNMELNENLEEEKFTNYIFEESGLTSLDYAGGQINSVKVSRTSIWDNPTKFYIESTGDYQGATRTIKVTGEMYDPIDFAKGVWVKGGVSTFNQNTKYYSNITSLGDLSFDTNTDFYGNILSKGSISLKNNATATSIVSEKDVEIFNNVTVTDYVLAGNNITVQENAGITGQAAAYNNIKMVNSAKIDGNVFYNGILDKSPQATITGTITEDVVEPVVVNIPPFPVLEESLFSQYPPPPTLEKLTDYYNLDGTFNLDGIYYVPGDLTIKGTYQGSGIIVTKGKVIINGNLTRYDENPSDNIKPPYSLAIIAFGHDAGGVGIDSQNNDSIEALLYTPNKIVLSNNISFYGSLICGCVYVAQNGTVTYDAALHENLPKWMTTTVKIKSWKESNPVF